MPSSAECLNATGVSAAQPRYVYGVYGLVVASEIELPELVPAPGRTPQVQVCFGPVPDDLDDAIVAVNWCQASRREFLLNIDEVARFHVIDGRQITVELCPDQEHDIPAADIRLWLLGSAFGALLHQRGMLPLHVSAVEAPGGVWAFTGLSGEGKSTLAGFLHRRFGWKLVSDDVSVITMADSKALVHAGPRKLKLWSDALEHLDFPGCRTVRDLSNTDKFQLYFPDDSGYRPKPLHGLVLLESGADDSAPEIERLKGADAFTACMDAVYRPYMEHWYKLPQQRMDELVQLCRQIQVYRFRRPRSLEQIEHNLAPLLALLAGPKPR